MTPPESVTTLLSRWQAGEPEALDRLMPQLYPELRRLASHHMRREREGHTFSATDLVAEAFLRLSGQALPDLRGRAHFLAVAARHMRQILVEHARKRVAEKRGGGVRSVTLGDGLVAADRPEELVALDEALVALNGFDERKARTVELHYFGGLEQSEIATLLGIHKNTVLRDLRMAEAWLSRFLAAP